MSSPPRPFTYDFSIWYCPEDDHVATSISERLEQEGFRGYVEHQDQVAGTAVILTATQVIQDSRVAILLLSTKSLRDPWCQQVSQWNLCHIIHCRGTKVIPVCLGVKKEQVPPFLQHLTHLHFHTKFFFQRLLHSLRTPCLVPAKAQHPPSSKAPP